MLTMVIARSMTLRMTLSMTKMPTMLLPPPRLISDWLGCVLSRVPTGSLTGPQSWFRLLWMMVKLYSEFSHHCTAASYHTSSNCTIPKTQQNVYNLNPTINCRRFSLFTHNTEHQWGSTDWGWNTIIPR